jgi:hypothetical protein
MPVTRMMAMKGHHRSGMKCFDRCSVESLGRTPLFSRGWVSYSRASFEAFWPIGLRPVNTKFISLVRYKAI